METENFTEDAKKFGALHRRVNGCLKMAIDAHGSITRKNFGSAGKRIAKMLLEFDKERRKQAPVL